jgi:hypothetical protein
VAAAQTGRKWGFLLQKLRAIIATFFQLIVSLIQCHVCIVCVSVARVRSKKRTERHAVTLHIMGEGKKGMDVCVFASSRTTTPQKYMDIAQALGR